MRSASSDTATADATAASRRGGAPSRGLRAPSGRALLCCGLLVGLLTQAAAASASSGWLRGVFPVVRFAGFTSPFGMRSHPLHGGVRPHHGLDIAAPLGSPVRSWWGGVVGEVIRDGGCGNGLVIRSGHYEHIYCHLAGTASGEVYRSGAVALRVGQRVRTGQVIAHVGLTGSTTGPHLHWGVRYRGEWLDPARILRAMANSRRGFSQNIGGMRSLGSSR